VNDLLVTKQSKCNDLQGQEQGLRNKAKGLSFKDLKIVLKDSLRPRTPIIESFKYGTIDERQCLTLHLDIIVYSIYCN